MPRRTPDASPLSRDRILDTAMAYADEHGLAALTMRRLGQELGVEAMSLYNHVPNKARLLDGMVDRVFAEVVLPDAAAGWRPALRTRAVSMREVLTRHPWAVALMESRTGAGPATLRQHDAVLAAIRTGGFSIPLAAHAFALLDAYVYGFAITEAGLPFDSGEDAREVASSIVENLRPDEYPYLVELAVEHVMQPGYSFADEFEWGLDLVLDGLERAASAPLGRPRVDIELGRRDVPGLVGGEIHHGVAHVDRVHEGHRE